jgi:serine/threonine protein phosphatase PrpC
MPDIKMVVSALTDTGRARSHNEDAYAITDLASGRQLDAAGADREIDVQDRGVLLALSDGMGGAQAGEVASALVLESLQEALATEGKGPIHEQLEAAVHRANRSVMRAAKIGNRAGMGATLTAVFVRGTEAFIAEVGDSRAYLLRNGRLRQITRDQSLVQLMVDQGVMSAQEARKSPGKNVILQAVGLDGDVRVAIAKLALRRGDRLLLCSDGVTNAVSDPELLQIMTQSDPRSACHTMIALANDRGGDDDETAIVADLSGGGLSTADEFETVTETYSVLKAYDATFRGKPATAEIVKAAGLAAGVRPASPSKPPPVVAAPDPAEVHAVPEALPDTPEEPIIASAPHLLAAPPPPSASDRRRLYLIAAAIAAVVIVVIAVAFAM